MTSLTPYLAFSGNCREAMTFYKESIGGDLSIQTMGESPMGEKTPAEQKNNVMHSVLTKNGTPLLFASDMFGADEVKQGTDISLCLNCTSEEEIKTIFEKLSAGGKVTSPLKTEFWGATFGMLIDKFGRNWMLNYDKKPKA